MGVDLDRLRPYNYLPRLDVVAYDPSSPLMRHGDSGRQNPNPTLGTVDAERE